jgi:hypothetical protein
LGSGSPDLSDLSIFFWYIFLIYIIFFLIIVNSKYRNINLFFIFYNMFLFITYCLLL